MTTEEKKQSKLHNGKVALLDVDDTLLFGVHGESRLNQALLDILIKANVKDIYLFTAMQLGRSAIEERNQLINELHIQGFTVHGVITPNDVAWAEVWQDTEAAKHLDARINELYQNKKTQEQVKRDNLWKFIQDNKSEWPHIAKAVQSGYNPTLQTIVTTNPLGVAYRSASDAYRKQPHIEDEADSANVAYRLYGATAQMLASDYLKSVEKSGVKYTDIKGFMYDLFVHHRPKWATSVIVADDKASVIETLDSFKLMPIKGQESALEVPSLKTIHIKAEEITTSVARIIPELTAFEHAVGKLSTWGKFSKKGQLQKEYDRIFTLFKAYPMLGDNDRFLLRLEKARAVFGGRSLVVKADEKARTLQSPSQQEPVKAVATREVKSEFFSKSKAIFSHYMPPLWKLELVEDIQDHLINIEKSHPEEYEAYKETFLDTFLEDTYGISHHRPLPIMEVLSERYKEEPLREMIITSLLELYPDATPHLRAKMAEHFPDFKDQISSYSTSAVASVG